MEAPSTTGRQSVAPGNLRRFGSGKHNKHTEAGFKECYRLGRVLGVGAFSTVYAAVDRVTGKEWACKKVTEEAERQLLLREVDILQQLDHPNLLKYRDHFNTPENLYIVTELLEGPDLLSAVLERGCYSEEDSREVIAQMLSALAYLDSKGVAHRDLKMENIVLVTEPEHTQVKIIDFGLADQLFEDTPAFAEPCGTPMYLAPEVVCRMPYGPSCDVWAAGVVLFMLLSGDYPFQAPSVLELVKKIRRGQLRFSDPIWELISPSATDLVKALMTPDPVERISAKDALSHPWISQ